MIRHVVAHVYRHVHSVIIVLWSISRSYIRVSICSIPRLVTYVASFAAHRMSLVLLVCLQRWHVWELVVDCYRQERSRRSAAACEGHHCAQQGPYRLQEVSKFLGSTVRPKLVDCRIPPHVPWYLPYPPWTFSCFPFCTSLSSILVRVGLS